jgi:hypothetical protein
LHRRVEEILKTISFYRYMTALDVTHLVTAQVGDGARYPGHAERGQEG